MSDISALWFIITVAAVWRVIVFIRQDALIEGTRSKLTMFFMRKDTLVRNKLLYLMDCPWCLGIWISGLAVLAWEFLDARVVAAVMAWLAVAALAAAADQAADRL